MKNTIRCCISCILPCGALDVIRIVHTNGRVEEITGTIRAADVMKAYPKHVLKKPTTRPSGNNYDDGDEYFSSTCRPAIVVVPPDAELQRGKIYFLVPAGPTKKKGPTGGASKSSSSSPLISSGSTSSSSTARRKRRESSSNYNNGGGGINNNSKVKGNNDNNNMVLSDQYLSELLSEQKISTQRERRRGRVAVWRPHLESISETLSEAASSTC